MYKYETSFQLFCLDSEAFDLEYMLVPGMHAIVYELKVIVIINAFAYHFCSDCRP